MNFQDAENTYRELKQRHAEGKLTDEEFEAEVTKLWCQDAQGRWWLIGVETGEWYMLDGEKWIKAQPPIASVMPSTTAAPPPPTTTAAAPPPPAPTTAAPTPTATPPPPVPTTAAPTPTATTTAAPHPPAPSAALSSTGQAMAVKGDAADQVTSGQVIAAGRENVAPAGKNQSTATMIGMIGIVAFVAILILISGYFIISSVLGGATGRATTTPTRLLALLPTLTLQVPTETPSPTSEATATEEGTPTRTPAKPTATRKPASPTPSGPTATATLNVSPGVYVTSIETIPAQVNLGDTIGFKVSFLNTTGSVQTFNWYVKWYQCPDQCQDFKHSQGESLLMNSNLATGTSAVITSQNINLRTGISCDLMVVANYVDPVNQLPTPFQATKSSGHFTFTPCH